MKKLYISRHLLAILCFVCLLSGNLFSQTNPPAQILPYTQNFEGLATTPTTYPTGFQGWQITGAATTTSYATIAPIADRSLVANSHAGTSSGNVHNYNGKIGFLDTGSLDLAIGFAFNSLNQTSIQVQYDAMVIRNPYDGTPSNNRIMEMALQYRIGTTGAFTTIEASAYLSGTVLQTGSGVTTPQNPQTIKVKLPSECDNQSVVQIRWIARMFSGTTGSRPSFAIDNIEIGKDADAPISETGYPKAENISANNFDFSDKLNEIGKTYYVLLAGGSTAPTAAQVKAGLDANGTAALQSGFLDVTDKNQVYTKNFAGLTLNTQYSVFSVSEDASGNIQTTVTKTDVTTTAVAVPVITVSVTSLDLGLTEINFNSQSLNYQIQATDLTQSLTVSATSNFSISKDNVTFGSELTFSVSDFAANASQTVYVRFTPNLARNFTGQLTHKSVGAVSKMLSLTGKGFDPYVEGFNDVNVLSNGLWTQHNIAGTVNKWTHTTVARNVNSGSGAVLVNGYSDNGPSKDWLISPKLHLDTFTHFALLSFYSRKFYAGPSLKLMVSTDYDGVSSPETATWAEIDGKFPTTTGTYVQSKYIDLTGFKSPNTYVAWVYETTAGGNNFAAEWSLDDVAITNETGYVNADPILDFGDVSINSISASQSFVLKAEGYGDIILTVPADYQISLDNLSFQSSVLVDASAAANNQTVYVRFTPSVKALKISGSLTVSGTALNRQIGSFTGSSIPKADTYDVVTYNLEFFGTDVKGTDGVEFGPTDDALQIENVAKVMNKLDADVYVVQEVSDDPSIDILIQKLNINGKTFDKKISTSWSYSFQDPDPNFPPQKLVVLYNTQTTSVKKTRVMFKDLYDEVRAGTTVLQNYPNNSGNSFFSSGRLPYMVTVEANVGGIKKEINLINIHARANSGSDLSRYNMRKYDTQVLKDSLDANYPDANFIILGDFNDDVKASVIAGQPSSYESIVTDTNRYNPLTLEISRAGAYSFLSSGGFLDHIVISNELTDDYIQNSIAVYDPRNDIPNYTTTTSDHGPVIARFELKEDVLSTPDFGKNNYFVKAYPNPASDIVSFDVKTTEGRDLKIKLYDTNGRLVGSPIGIKSEADIKTASLSVNSLSAGIYFYVVTENNKVIFKDKIIKN
ncbi:T9SS-dependent choice-of-anchor J family protein [Flavobacterium foetidum]|uniref:T9SS-dependent choice-of-anchor J family protein n=1 Tax=Flavobacterium foetidum TaxID=2026681 RepID=UPI00107557AC|nr:choice-of-anchor J domain-containing protein [Flavobacterium foetidum]KAF2514323.1 T9SS type A sorting domain-containing protein [Flavobacterium foetidum]